MVINMFDINRQKIINHRDKLTECEYLEVNEQDESWKIETDELFCDMFDDLLDNFDLDQLDLIEYIYVNDKGWLKEAITNNKERRGNNI